MEESEFKKDDYFLSYDSLKCDLSSNGNDKDVDAQEKILDDGKACDGKDCTSDTFTFHDESKGALGSAQASFNEVQTMVDMDDLVQTC